ncbi:MAG: 3-dehydroquinate synthase [Verrucomicrobiales bacterium]|jgi:3-dehydroquinate synthase
MTPDHCIHIDLGTRSYDVLVGRGLLAESGALISQAFGRKSSGACVIVSDSNVGALYRQTVEASLRAVGFSPTYIEVTAGEASKSMSCVESVCRQMAQAGLDRGSFLVALGGGVVGDLAGYAASIFFRGISFVQIPTSIVAQVDSSVGGKTGVNMPEGKNLLGCFHQPKLVIADVETLRSLPDREYREGFAEVIKHAGIRDADMVDMIAAAATIDDRADLGELIARNVRIKAVVVVEDEQERTGTRALLNFGHTIGHAIESSAGYGQLLHGEAISLGLVAAIQLSRKLAGLSEKDAEALIGLLKMFKLPLSLGDEIGDDAILSAMRRDKKFDAGEIRFVLARAIGDAFVSKDVSWIDIEEAVAQLRSS